MFNTLQREQPYNTDNRCEEITGKNEKGEIYSRKDRRGDIYRTQKTKK